MAEEAMERAHLVYNGGLANVGELQFYEYGRAVYGYARFLSTLEHFRRTGRVAQRITSENYVEVRIRAPEKGSFGIEALVPLLPDIQSYFSAIPLKVLTAYIVRSLTSLFKKDEDKVLKLAALYIAADEEKSRQETKRMKEIRKMVSSNNVVVSEAIKMLENIAAGNPIVAAADLTDEEVKALLTKLKNIGALEQVISENEGQLSAIDERLLLKLAAKVRPQIEEIGKPLNRSADNMTMGYADDKKIVKFSREDVEHLKDREIDEDVIETKVWVAAFDRGTNSGKADLKEFELRRVAFTLGLRDRAKLKDAVASALRSQTLSAQIRLVRDVTGAVTSFILYSLGPDSSEEQATA